MFCKDCFELTLMIVINLRLTSLLTILFISLLSSPSWSETMYDLAKRNDLYFEKLLMFHSPEKCLVSLRMGIRKVFRQSIMRILMS